jgi:hypothetical protein
MEDAATRKKNCKREKHELPSDHLGGSSSLSSPHQRSPMQLHCVKILKTSNQRHRRGEKCPASCAEVSATREISENMSVSSGSQFV